MNQEQKQATGEPNVPTPRPEAEAGIPFVERLTCTIAEACKATGLGRTKLYELIGEGRVDTARIGRRRLVKVRSLQRLVDMTAANQPALRSDAESDFDAAQNAAQASMSRRRFSKRSPRR